ncbi:MAG TPA: hypothetical protein PKW35_17985 [Nannocystaceae bacterium]|nr:hypothetical protein [Nannocystaceae bacterium]
MRRTLSAILCLALACGPDAPSDESDTADTSEAADARDLPGLDYDAFLDLVLGASSGGSGEADADVDDEATDEAADEAADGAIAFTPRQCIHRLDERRPRITKAAQRHTKQVIAHVTRRMGSNDNFRKLLSLVALRESSYQQGLVHRLSADLTASYQAWRRLSTRYEGNPHSADPTLWQTYGLFGMNANYFTLLWDPAADPRVLCDPIVDIILYRRAAERALRKMQSGPIRCKGSDGETFDVVVEPTWGNLHRAVNGGKICPSKSEERAATMRKYFNNRAARYGIDPEEVVTLKSLGKEPSRGLDGESWASQEAMVMGLWKEIEAGAADDLANEPIERR